MRTFLQNEKIEKGKKLARKPIKKRMEERDKEESVITDGAEIENSSGIGRRERRNAGQGQART